MKTTAGWLIGALVFAAATAHGGAETATSPATTALPSMQRENVQEVSATVTALDKATRNITLKDDTGGTASFVAGPEVKNFPQIRVGDKVVISYYQGISAQLLPPGTVVKKETNQIDLSAKSEEGTKPGAGVGSAIRGTVVVQKVDTKANTVTVLKPDGKSRTVPVESDEGRAFLKKLKKGDKVDVVYAEALAVEVRSAGK